jgi:outer membrane protein insertion porin family
VSVLIDLKNSSALRLCAVSFALALAPTIASVQPVIAQSSSAFVFDRIDVSGNQRISSDTVRILADLPTGTRLSPGRINDALQNLTNSGLFQTVNIRTERGRAIIEVVENPTINRVSIEGNRRLDDKDLLPLLQSQSRRAFSASIAEADVAAIVEAYSTSGRLGTNVDAKIIRRTDNRVDLVFEVSEGKVTEVRRIGFVGNRNYSDRRLRRSLASKQAGVLKAFFGNDTFIQERLEFDKQQLRDFYLSRGYLDFRVNSSTAELARSRDSFLVTFNIQEGQQYRVGDVSVINNINGLDTDGFEKLFSLKTGAVFDNRRLDTALERMDDRSAQDGFPFARVTPRFVRNDDDRTVDIEFEINQGPRQFVERIDIQGNASTLDRVIRRQFKIAEGDAFNRREVGRAADRIRALGFFSNVSVESREGSNPDQAVVDVNVEEQPTGSLSFGVTFNSEEGAAATASLSQRNFLGRGQLLSASVSTAKDAEEFSLTFREPSVFDRDLSAGVNLFYSTVQANIIPLDQVNIGIRPTVSFPVSEFGRVSVGYRLSQDELTLPNGATVSPIITTDVGKTITSSLILGYSVDKRNSLVDPSSGYIFSLNQEIAGLGGDQEFSKTTAKIKGFKSFLGEELIVSAELEGGVLSNFGSGSRIIDRFQLGGDTLRGFASGGIGPRDAAVTSGDSLGGNFFAVARLEASFPLGLPEEYGIFGGVFLDAGSVWGLDNTNGFSAVDDSASIRSAAGVSLFWETALGPLRFNWSRPIEKKSYDTTENFRFTVQARF